MKALLHCGVIKVEEQRNCMKTALTFFKEIEQNVITLIKEELMRFRKLLGPSSSLSPERGVVKDEEEQNSVQEAVLKITLHVLRNMKLYDLAYTLQNKVIPKCQKKLKCTLRRKFERINEGLSKHGNSKLLTEIFTELYVTEGDSGEINSEHEDRQIEAKAVKPGSEDVPIKCSELFKPSAGWNASIRTVLTKGVAGIGKTISVQKFIVDWAEGNENEDIHFIFPLPFRELNLMKEKKLSLMNLLFHFFPETSDLHDYGAYKVLFIFDGLDETRLPLDFQNNAILKDRTEPASLDVLLTNLIMGNLLPSALLSITSRPAAAHQIPPDHVDRVTEVRGFSDAQEEEYFRKRIHDPGLANRMITHLRSTRSLYIMCHILVFCWITATVLERMLTEAGSKEIPKTLTQMFIYFLIFQTKHRVQRYGEDAGIGFRQTQDRIVAPGKLALQQLKRGNLIFYEDDLMDCGIEVREVSVYSGMCTEIFREEFGLYLGKVYCFVHLSVQEFLAALYVFISFSNTERSEVAKNSALTHILKKAVDKALHSKNGHLDLFLRFLLGISLDSNQALLRGLITPSESSHSREETITYIKEKIRQNPSPNKSINLFHCLNELNDQSLVEEVQMYLNRKGLKRLSGARFSPVQWSALVFVLLNSEGKLEEINLNDYERSETCFLKLLPVIQASRKAVLSSCNLTELSCTFLTDWRLRELNLSNNKLQDSGVKMLCTMLEITDCKLEVLKLRACGLTKKSCSALSTVLTSASSRIQVLDLSNNNLQDSVIEMVSAAEMNPHSRLRTLRLPGCSVTQRSCLALAILFSSQLTEVNLGRNELSDSGVKLLSEGIKNSPCKLQKLKLSDCGITESGCSALPLALSSNPSHLRELDLSSNRIRDSGVKLLSDYLGDSRCVLKKLGLFNCGLTGKSCTALVSALMSNPSHLSELNLGGNDLTHSALSLLFALVQDPFCALEKLEAGIQNATC